MYSQRRLACAAALVLGLVACSGQSLSIIPGDDAGRDGTLGHAGSAGAGGSGASAGSGGAGGGGGGGGEGGHDEGGLPDGGGDSGCLTCKVASCDGGPDETQVTGYAYAPNGQLPLYDVQVFIPTVPLAALPKGVQCDNCASPVSGKPVATALTDATGAFTLKGVPAGDSIPIVVQVGKWRREAIIPKVTACTTTALTDPNLTRLPKNQSEGNMPHIALVTGGCDQMGCILPKLGIDTSEFGAQADGYTKAINVYNGGGGVAGLGATAAENLWGDQTLLDTYDEAIFSCECSEALDSKGGKSTSPPFGIVTSYLNAGGRLVTTDFQYTWYKYSTDPNLGGGSPSPPGKGDIGIGQIYGGAPAGASPLTISTSLPKAIAQAAWLKNVFSGNKLPSGTTFPEDGDSQKGEIAPDYVFANTQWVASSKAVTWASSAYDKADGGPPPPKDAGGVEPRIFAVDTPVGMPSASQCGRAVHLDAHIDTTQSVGAGYPTSGCTSDLVGSEGAFAFFFVDVNSCISDESVAPQPPAVAK